MILHHEQHATTAATVDADAPPRSPRADRAVVMFAVALAVWSVAYLAPHLYWALDGTIGLSALKPSAPAVPEWRAINWAATGVLALPALIAAAVVRARPGAFKASLSIACLVGAAIAAGHGLYGIVYRSLTVAGMIDIDGRSFDAARQGWVVWDLLVFEPWFLIEGLLFAGFGWAASPPRFRRTWIIACATGVTLATISALVGLRV